MNKYFGFIIVIFLSASCSVQTATLVAPPKQSDIAITPVLKTFLASQNAPAIVLRTPNISTSPTQEERNFQSATNVIFNRIEKELMKAGFPVRDRGLLNSLLTSGQVSYAELGKKTETDIIIEIVSISFRENDYHNQAVNNKTGKKITFDRQLLNSCNMQIECKFVLVEKGLTGAMATLYASPCENGQSFGYSFRNGEQSVFFPQAGGIQYGSTAGIAWMLNDSERYYNIVRSLSDKDHTVTIKTVNGIDKAADYFARQIANILRGHVQ